MSSRARITLDIVSKYLHARGASAEDHADYAVYKLVMGTLDLLRGRK